MRNILYLIFTAALLNSCVSLKQKGKTDKEKIIYIVPDTVQLWFNNVIKEPMLISKKENVYFIIGESKRNNKLLFNLNLCDALDYDYNDRFFYKNTNRYIYIKGDLYPLLSDLDQVFSTRDYGNKELLDLLEKQEKIKQYYRIYERTYWVVFDNNWGDIIETSDDSKGGYKTNSPNKLN